MAIRWSDMVGKDIAGWWVMGVRPHPNGKYSLLDLRCPGCGEMRTTASSTVLAVGCRCRQCGKRLEPPPRESVDDFEGGMTFKEIAEALNISPTLVRNIYGKAIEKMKIELIKRGYW